MQASLKLVLEPIFEADFKPCSYGFRPRRRAHDAIAEIHLFATQGYTWVLEGDITACFDEISHSALLTAGAGSNRGQTSRGTGEGVPPRRRPLRGRGNEGHQAGTPQGGILSPLLANIALSVLDEHFVEAWERDMATRPRREPVAATEKPHTGRVPPVVATVRP